MEHRQGFDPRDPRLRIDPYPILHQLRRTDPVHWSEGLGTYVLTRYDDVMSVARSPRFGTPRELFLEELGGRLGDGYAFDYVSRRLTYYDNPDLSRLRGLAQRAFTPRRTEALRPWIATVTERLLDQAEDAASGNTDGIVDLRELVFHPLPSMVISELLGIPAEDRLFFDRSNDPLTHLTAPFLDVEQVRAGEAAAQLEWIRLEELVADRRRHAQDDLLSALIASEDDAGGRFEPAELIALLMMLFSAGHHTTRDALGMGLFGLLSRAEQLPALHDDPALIDGAVEEVLRWDSSLAMTTRTARIDTAIGDVAIPAGTRCYLHFLAANRDPARFEDPDRFDLHRADTTVASFGGGMHHCLGSALARVEIECVIAALARRYPTMVLPVDPWRDLEWRTNLVFRGPLSVPVQLLGPR